MNAEHRMRLCARAYCSSGARPPSSEPARLSLQVSTDDCRRAVAALEQVLLDLNDAMGKAPGDAGYVNISATAGAGYGGAISY